MIGLFVAVVILGIVVLAVVFARNGVRIVQVRLPRAEGCALMTERA